MLLILRGDFGGAGDISHIECKALHIRISKGLDVIDNSMVHGTCRIIRIFSFAIITITLALPNRKSAMTGPSQLQIVHAYRNLYRTALRAVQYSTPTRYQLQDRMRTIFRKGNPANFDQARIDNTILFLEGAAREKGMEHRILKNYLHVWRVRSKRSYQGTHVPPILITRKYYSCLSFEHTTSLSALSVRPTD